MTVMGFAYGVVGVVVCGLLAHILDGWVSRLTKRTGRSPHDTRQRQRTT